MTTIGCILLALFSIYAGSVLLNSHVLRDPINWILWPLSLLIMIVFLVFNFILIFKRKKYICWSVIVIVFAIPVIFDFSISNLNTAIGFCQNYNSFDWSSVEFIECRSSMSWFDRIKFGYTNQPKK